MQINYEYLDNGTHRIGTWEGDPSEALSAAVEYLGAEYAPDDEAWIYQAPESGEEVLLEDEDLVAAGAAILSGASDWYSVWCASTGTPVGR